MTYILLILLVILYLFDFIKYLITEAGGPPLSAVALLLLGGQLAAVGELVGLALEPLVGLLGGIIGHGITVAFDVIQRSSGGGLCAGQGGQGGQG